ncbi:MAG: hypothetical protein P4L52_01495 [Acidocella sp.]|nr:hypothetical protein [Acidocella sp.]
MEALHVAGLPGVKANEKGKLVTTAAGLVFNGKSGAVTVPAGQILAVEVGNQRVELWGMKGRLLRMAIPQGGGLVAATFMHHRVDMLTVEFEDAKGGYHAAVFYAGREEMQQALQQLATATANGRQRRSNRCEAGKLRPDTVRVLEPGWNDVEVPAAYRALVYEDLVKQLAVVKGISQVYRDGEQDADGACPAYTVELTATGYKQGSQVARASTGPVGLFVGTTQLKFDARITSAVGGLDYRAELRATVRGETESIKVADGVAKKLAKEFAKSQKQYRRPNVVTSGR